MFNIVICDDNEGYMSLFKSIVNKQFRMIMNDESMYRIDACFGSGTGLLEYAEDHKIDVLFLDIDMPEMTGFEIAKIMSREHSETLIVFMSAYDNFVYESFDYLPFAYMRKETIAEDIPKVAYRIKDKLLEQTRYITLLSANKEIRVDSKEILYFESKKNYFVAYLINGSVYSCRGTLSKLEKETESLGFFRTHSAFLVNLEHADRVVDNKYILVGTTEIPIAQKRSKEFKKAFLEFTRRRIGV